MSTENNENDITFHVDDGAMEILRFASNGDIFVKGKLIENDKEVVDGFRQWLKEANRKESQ